MISKSFLFVILSLSLVIFLPIFQAPAVAGYVPHQGDYFNYHEVETLGNGTGSYAGYTEQTVTNGGEQMDGVTEGIVSANYNYSYNWSNNQASTTAGTQSGSYTFSSTTLLYVSGTDDETGYVNPTVWFYINSSVSVGSTVFLLNTGATVMSRNYSYYLPSLGKDVTTVFVQGTASYYGSPDDNAYGLFNAKYTWDAYFDPTTGYIVGYNYVEHDTNSSGDGFTWTDNLYVTSTSYPLTATGVSSTGTGTTSLTQSTSSVIIVSTPPASSNSTQYLGYIAGAVIVIVIVAILIYALSRRSGRALPKHSQEEPSSGPPPEGIDLTPTQQPPVQQIVIKEVAKKTCKYCGALMDTTAQVCPRCGAPNT